MDLLGLQTRLVSGPEIADLGNLNGTKPVQNQFKVVANHLQWVLGRFGAV